jgi:hypothetical protein
MDFHFDWGASHFFAKQLQLGVVGYYFQQSPTISALPQRSAASARGSPASGRRSATSSEWATSFRISQPEGLQGVRASESSGGLEYVLTFAISPASEPPAAAKPLSRKY